MNSAIVKIGCLCFMTLGWAQASTVDVNVASVQALQAVTGIGAVTAQRIVTERARGPYESLEHLAERLSGIGPKRIKKLEAAGLCAGTAQSHCAAPSSKADRMVPQDRRPSEGVTPALIHLP